ncbi:carbohydrate-binding family 9-like protein [Dyadobacter sp. CY356]|uniref:carbohydrate-binding family 9-like protein n=1 Tax=Dyadobacter sp. CY356 TaxID=2906442 RepID=UPI001F45CF04|nr:carbohydrate-binding family 9-like protein [Dyadobacter sp. CY356]MCF0057105.1 carbohydrate-binding family 9-like protein [Dyadobacter sp. CY356]
MKSFILLIGKTGYQFYSRIKLKFASFLAITGCFFIPVSSYCQAADPPKKYVCFQTRQEIIIDGKMNEKSWKDAEWTTSFEDIEGQKKPLPLQNTQVKMLWDEKYLYIAAVMDEEHIWAYQNKKDQIVYLENDFEVFIDPDNDTDNYYELEINALNNSFDLFLPKPYKKGGKPQLTWDIKNLRSAVSVEGTINDGTDKDKRWTLEIAIPFESLSTENVPFINPEPDKIWRINFSRVNWQFQIDEKGKYSRKKNTETGKILPEYNWVWSPQGVINMHVPEHWGFLEFNRQKVGKGKR